MSEQQPPSRPPAQQPPAAPDGPAPERGASGRGIGVGTVLAETYEVTRLIGQGGMGAVWAARHLRLPKEVAVKVLLGGAREGSEAYARFRREAEIASRLGHPHIVEVIDFNALPGGSPYLVMELLSGESLAGRLRRGPLSLPETVRVVRQIASALTAAHRRQVIHRDLKPENIFLCRREVDGDITDFVKVLDFGISKIRGSASIHTQTSEMLGTPQYMAPEQVAGQHDLVDERTDQFALAAIVYEMIANRPAFEGQSLAEVVHKIVYEERPPLRVPGVPPAVEAAVMRGLARRREDRFPDIASLVEALASGVPHAGVAATVGTASPEAPGAVAMAATVGATSSGASEAAAVAATVAATSPGATGPAVASAELARAATVAAPLSGAPGTPGAAPASAASGPAPRRRVVLVLVGAAVALGLAAGAYLLGQRRPLSHEARGGDPPLPADAAVGVVPTVADAAVGVLPRPGVAPGQGAADAAPTLPGGAPRDAAATVSTDARRAGAAGGGRSQSAGGSRSTGAAPRPMTEPEGLREARQALRRGDYVRAEALARRALRQPEISRNVSGRAYAVLVEAACGQRALGRARGLLARVPRSLRPRVVRACRGHGLDLR